MSGAGQGFVWRATGDATMSGQANVDLNAARNRSPEAAGAAGAQSSELRGSGAQAGETAAKTAAGGAWWSFAMLLFGLLAAAYAGSTERQYYHNITGEPAR